jgi:hypothetical protein
MRWYVGVETGKQQLARFNIFTALIGQLTIVALATVCGAIALHQANGLLSPRLHTVVGNFTQGWDQTQIMFAVGTPAGLLLLSSFRRIWDLFFPDDNLDPAQIAIFQRAARYGWIVDFMGDGYYHLYGPNGEREQFGDLADLEWFVSTLEEQDDQTDNAITHAEHHHRGVGSESVPVSTLDG